MEFNSNQEDIYDKLVGNSKGKYGKDVQVKYELTRPRKKQKKKSDTARFEIVKQLNKEAQTPASEEVYSVPPDEEDLEDDGDFINDSIDTDESVEAPPPPPRSDSLLPSETSSLSSNELSAPINETYQLVSDDIQNTSNLYQEVTNITNVSQEGTNDQEGIYAPRNWRQQNYESWTPFFNPASKTDPPPPTKAPPIPPVIQAPSENVQKEKSRRERGYETWTPLASSDPPPPSHQPPKPPGHASPKPYKQQMSASKSSPRPGGGMEQPPSQPQAHVDNGDPRMSASQPPIYSQSTKRQFLATPKQITGIKKTGQPTAFIFAQGQEEPRRPSRPAPKPPTSKPVAVASKAGEEEEEEGHIRLSPIKDSLPSASLGLSLEEDMDQDRLYEPCNWRRQLKAG